MRALQCDCDECQKRWFAELIEYATTLEGEVLAVIVTHFALSRSEKHHETPVN